MTKRYPSGVPVGATPGHNAYDSQGGYLGLFVEELSDHGSEAAIRTSVEAVSGKPVAFHSDYTGQSKALQVPLYGIRTVSTKTVSRMKQGLVKSIDGSPAWVNVPDLKLGSM